jgi:hypothetical protein
MLSDRMVVSRHPTQAMTLALTATLEQLTVEPVAVADSMLVKVHTVEGKSHRTKRESLLFE